MFERKPPQWASIWSSSTSLLVLRRPTSGLEFVVRNDQFYWPTIDAAHAVDAIDRHLHTDQRGLAAGRAGARQRIDGTDLVRLRLAKGRAPRSRHEHQCTDRTAAPTDDTTTVAEELDADVVAIGSRGRTGLTKVLLGSVASAVAQHSGRSVLIVNPETAGSAGTA